MDRSPSWELMNAGGKIDVAALLRAQQEQTDSDDSPVEAVFTLSRDLDKRLDRYLVDRIPFLSRTSLQRLIAEEAVTVNGRAPKASTHLHLGDVVRVTLPPPPSKEIPAEDIALRIVHEDAELVVIDKEDDMIVHPARGNQGGTIINALAWRFANLSDGQLSTVGADQARPGVVHRLDRHTTGVLVAAKTETAHWRLGKQFQDRTTRKRYLAVVHGEVEPLADVIDLPLGKHPTQRTRYAVRHDDTGKPSVTLYRVRERYEGFTLLELELRTGRTHQIRLHLSHLGWPVVGDDIYGGRHLTVADVAPRDAAEDRRAPLMTRQALHAALLGFVHPASGEDVTYLAPLHDDMDNLVTLLRRYRFLDAPTVAGVELDLDALISAS